MGMAGEFWLSDAQWVAIERKRRAGTTGSAH
jgi:hypothetical protein